MRAASAGQDEAVRSLIDAGAGIGQQDNKESTALLLAAAHGHASTLVELLQRPAGLATLEMRNDVGRTPLVAASYGGHSACVEALIMAGASLNAVDIRGVRIESVVFVVGLVLFIASPYFIRDGH
eukprot:SAG31_NODE_4602_length_3103_cov_3.619174_2_plen_125_part_00